MMGNDKKRNCDLLHDFLQLITMNRIGVRNNYNNELQKVYFTGTNI